MAAKIIYFSTGTCAPCKIMYPIIEKLALEQAIPLVKIDANNDIVAVSDYNVMAVPTIVFIKDEKEVSRVIGFSNKVTMLEKIKLIV